MNFGIRNHQYKVLFYLFALVFPESIIGQQVNLVTELGSVTDQA